MHPQIILWCPRRESDTRHMDCQSNYTKAFAPKKSDRLPWINRVGYA